ncbi:hypothetical protein HAX54_042390, partial [Datura stramonium]|nr:hypothetical protein [Datura stramonium]
LSLGFTVDCIDHRSRERPIDLANSLNKSLKWTNNLTSPCGYDIWASPWNNMKEMAGPQSKKEDPADGSSY